MAEIKVLNYELAPSPATIFGCLLPAPWLGAAAGLLLAFASDPAFPGRFAPLTLSLTHWLVLGMLAPVMIGALFQLMPVVAGQTVGTARFIAPFVALGSAATAAALSAGFLWGEQRGFALAGVLASVLYGAVVLALASAAWKVIVTDATTRTLRWIALALALVVGLGVSLAGTLAGWWQVDVLHWVNLHAAWALAGWIAALVLGVASTVVPMFWQTERPTVRWQASLPTVLWAPLLLATLLPPAWPLALGIGCLVLGGFAAVALYSLFRAKRRFDPAWILWVVCACSWLLAVVLTLLACVPATYLPDALVQALPWWIGVAALVGGAVLPVNAMLGKIIPFLIFLHLRRQIPAGRRVPTMQAVLPPQRLQWQARLVLSALALLLLVPLAPGPLKLVAGLLFAASQGLMGGLLFMSLLRYRKELVPVLLAKRVSAK